MSNPNPTDASSDWEREFDLPASIDYRLRSKAIARAFKNGQIFRSQICDAHPELLRAAEGVGEAQEHPCPICSEEKLVNLRYVFGKRLNAVGGRCMANMEELYNLARTRKGSFTCYVVEVCTGCSWNFLIQSFPFYGRL